MSDPDIVVAVLLVVAAALAARAAWVAATARARLPRLQAALASAFGVVGADWPIGGLPIGSRFPAKRLRALDGRSHDVVAPGERTLVLLTKGGELMNERLGSIVDRLPDGIRATAVVDVPESAAGARLANAPTDVLLDPAGVFVGELLLERLPAAVVVDENGRTSTPFALGPVPVRELVDTVHEALRPPTDSPDRFDAFTVIDREGVAATITVDGRPLVIAVLGNTCRHSTRLIPTLREFAARGDGPDLRVVIAGGYAPTDPMIDAPVLIDNTDQASVRFGYRGTPALIHVDTDGTVLDIVSGTRACMDTLHAVVTTTKEMVDHG